MKKINCIVVDDEPHSIDLVEYYAQKTPQINLLQGCLKPSIAIEVLQNQEVDLVFLDMQMPEMRGDELIASIKTNAKIIITSAYPRYNTAVFGEAYVDYLLKPYTLEQFQASVKKYEDKLAGQY